MKKQFATYAQDYLSQIGDDVQNIVFELMARCINDGTRLIIEQGATYGQKYLMVDFSPTDKSNTNFITDNGSVCCVSSVKDNEEGDTFKDFRNYMDACRWLSDFLRGDDYGVIYTESY